MKVRMKSTRESAVDGIHTRQYARGRTYSVPDEVAKRWVRKGWASILGKAKVEPEEAPAAEEPEETPEETKEKDKN